MTLPFGPLGNDTAHLAIDMQMMFAVQGEWRVPGLAAIVPPIAAIARHRPGCSLFVRFIAPPTADDAVGVWRRYYRRWSAYTGQALAPGMTDLVDGLRALAPPGDIVDKSAHSALAAPALHARLQGRGIGALVVSGIETDVCVLATVLQAVDLGYRVVVARDAVASASPAAHAATLEHVLPRLDQQVEIAGTAAILAAWS